MNTLIVQLFAVTSTSIVLCGFGDSHQPITERVYWDTVTESGEFAGGNLMMQMQDMNGIETRGLVNVEVLLDNGPSSNRIDLVFVGDGYRSVDLDDYADHVSDAMNAFFAIEPLQSYKPLFNVHRVDVISNETGVDNDPYDGIDRDTAMNMRYWCSGIERLLCIDTSLAWSYANNVPSTDAILAVANSSMYGGAGYSSSEIGTFAGANSAATEIAIHEIGHSLANLADEYTYGGSDYYTGDEPIARNASIYTSSEMAANGTKWAAWLGENDWQWDGLVDTFEGALYSAYDVYRPTTNSMMRSLGRQFNQPSAEAFIIEMYGIVDPVDEHTPFQTLSGHDDVYIVPIVLEHAMDITWSIDGEVLLHDGETELELSSLALSAGMHILQVTVVDPTEWVRDEAARNSIMKQTLSWNVQVVKNVCMADITGDGQVGVNDILVIIAEWGECDGCSADINVSGTVDVTDLLIVIDGWGECP